MGKAELQNLASRAVAPAVGDYLIDAAFEATLPELPTPEQSKVRPDYQTLLQLEDPLRRLDLDPAEGPRDSISVIVCTRDRAETLERCLESLLNCSPGPEEILVVDNCPTSDATRQLVDRYPRVQYVLERREGLDMARNTGIRHARGQILAFADDDVTVHADWIRRLGECFSDSQVMAATGLVLPAELETEAQGMFEQYWGFNRGYRVLTYDSNYFEMLKPRGVPAWQVGAGANMAFRREAFDVVGDFDVRLDVGAAGCSGDSELWYRLLAAGLTCRYDPRVTAFHYHRKEMIALRHQMYWYMRGHTAALLVQFAKHGHWGNLFRLFVLLPLYYAKVILRGLRRGFDRRHRMIPIEWMGCLSGCVFFLRHMRSTPNDQARRLST
jgi:GT2 family glycosyltransferase